MKPKNKEDILYTCQSNFNNYSILSKIFIAFGVLLSIASSALYIVKYIIPTGYDIISGEITGWDIVWKICLAIILYYAVKFVNLISVSIGGSAMCREEDWETIDFAKAWLNMYEEVYEEEN
jgi:hypothetical protein